MEPCQGKRHRLCTSKPPEKRKEQYQVEAADCSNDFELDVCVKDANRYRLPDDPEGVDRKGNGRDKQAQKRNEDESEKEFVIPDLRRKRVQDAIVATSFQACRQLRGAFSVLPGLFCAWGPQPQDTF